MGEFVANTLREHARANALSPEEFVDRAARYYLSEPSSMRPARRIPAFVKRGSAGRPIEFHVELEETPPEQLQAAAALEGTSVERVLEHAVLLLIADLDSGRVAARFIEQMHEPPHDRDV
jgi:hypothetical protein